MKENLFEMLLSLFEKSLTQLREKEKSADEASGDDHSIADEALEFQPGVNCLKAANELSTRIFTQGEQIKMTKAGYQFLTRVKLWGIIDPQLLELVIHQLQFSDSRIVTLQEVKWTIRNILAEGLDAQQLAFLDLVLYQKEDQLTLH